MTLVRSPVRTIPGACFTLSDCLRFLAGCAILGSFSTLAVPPAVAHTLSKARVALHVQSHPRKIPPCLSPDRGGPRPDSVPCSEFITSAEFQGAYDVYLIVARVDTVTGIAGLSCGIDYKTERGAGVDIFSWRLCADQQFVGNGPNGAWPNAGGGNMIVWAPPAGCRRDPIPGYENQEAHAIAGAFYLYAYSEDVLRVTANTTRVIQERFTVGDCLARETELQDAVMGEAHFLSETGSKGCNPCGEPCAPSPTCLVDADTLDFGHLAEGTFRELPLEIHNPGPGRLRGLVEPVCFPYFSIVQGFEAYILEPGESQRVIVRYLALDTLQRVCLLYVANVCEPVVLIANRLDVETDEDPPGKIDLRSRPGDRVQRMGFRLAVSAPVTFSVYDVAGRVVHRADAGPRGAGDQVLEWNTDGLASGVYFLRIQTPQRTLSQKLTLLR